MWVNGGWKIKLIMFVGGTSGSVIVQIAFNDNLEEFQVFESKRNAIRKGLRHSLVYELLNAHDTVLIVFRAEIGRAE